MEGWSESLFAALDTLAIGIEQVVSQIIEDVGGMVDAFVESSEEIAEQVQTVLEMEIEPRLNSFIDPILEAYLGFELELEDTAQPLFHTVEPMLNNYPACVGCRHYHGQVYGGNLLVCGMHPYGWEEEKCPDWESVWTES